MQPTAMGKGVLPDNHENCVSPARSLALQKADVILLLGARLNWMLHFGRPPRFNPNVKIIQVHNQTTTDMIILNMLPQQLLMRSFFSWQVDIEPEEFHHSIPTEVSLCGDVNAVTEQLVQAAGRSKLTFSKGSQWWGDISKKIEQNRKTVEVTE